MPDAVYRPVQVFLLAADFDVGLVHSPARADWLLALAKHRCERRHHLDRPSVNRGVVDRHPALAHRLFKIVQSASCILRLSIEPAYAYRLSATEPSIARSVLPS